MSFPRPIVLSLGSALVAGLGIAACGSDDTSSGAAVADLDGVALYASNCASCHGSDLRGSATGPSHLSIVYEPNHHGDASFRAAVTNGAVQHHWNFGDMPPVTGLDDDEIDAIIDFVRAEQEGNGFEPYPP